MNVFTSSNMVLAITTLLLMKTCLLNVTALDFSGDTYIPNCFVLL
jgi:hypothetical protein